MASALRVAFKRTTTRTTMPPQQFLVRLQHGITVYPFVALAGGFAPPTPNAIHQLTRSTDTFIESMVRPDGTPSLQPRPPKIYHHGSYSLVDELHAILKQIPTEKPPGIEDIYGLDTSIMWASDDLEWFVSALSVLWMDVLLKSIEYSECWTSGLWTWHVRSTEEEKAKFKRAIEIVTQLTQLES
ncbi:hypothetical protein RHS01_05804 [Rhizoctonia solani]|uniref:Uncharacterized protein n=1 Tax=Rhizoctonia solani TaxID=456999 RepID=A0A8H7M4D4_9AGAM|nr:hypothetical protein RHS01_05804 [Rhizoctonia solani]